MRHERWIEADPLRFLGLRGIAPGACKCDCLAKCFGMGQPAGSPGRRGSHLGLLTFPPVGDADFQARASQPAVCDRNLHSLKITSRSCPPSPSSIFPATSELYPFVFFLLRDHSN